MASLRIRPIDRSSDCELVLVAERMRLTLAEVLGKEEGEAMYTLDWLLDRARQHIDGRCDGEILLAELGGQIVGHTILRIEPDERLGLKGLFSTFYVDPNHRRKSIASRFLEEGEAWFRARSMKVAQTYTAADNRKLHRLMEGHGYRIVLRKDEMVAFSKILAEDLPS